jgi:hypothetical protein
VLVSGPTRKSLQRLEARVGIEPTHKGFADLSLTTWVPRPAYKLAFRAEKVHLPGDWRDWRTGGTGLNAQKMEHQPERFYINWQPSGRS